MEIKVLIACEFSGVVREEFRKRGHDAWSCDLLPSDTDNTWHFQQDVLEILYDDCWEMLIAFPTCTYLCNSGVHLLHKDESRWQKMVEAAIFFRTLLCADIPKVIVENPVMHKYAIKHIGQKQNQTIQPYEFGHDASKRTCLWLKGVFPLQPTKLIKPTYRCKCGGKFEYELGKYGCPGCCGDSGAARGVWGNQTPSGQNKLGPTKDRWKKRSKTYSGIAKAMAEQWG